MKINLANPRGFCAGVDRAIEIVEQALEIFGAPIYVRHEVVHNTFVVNSLKTRAQYLLKNLKKYPKTQQLFLVLMVFHKQYSVKPDVLDLKYLMQPAHW